MSVTLYFLIVFNKRQNILRCFNDITLLKSLILKMMNKCRALEESAVLVINSFPCTTYGWAKEREREWLYRWKLTVIKNSLIWQHADCSIDWTQITSRNTCRRLIIDANLKRRRTPIDETNCLLALDVSNCEINFCRFDIASIEHATANVFAFSRVAFDKLWVRMEAGVGDLLRREVCSCTIAWNEWSISTKWEVYSWVGNEIRLKFNHVDINCTGEAERCRATWNNLTNDSIEIRVRRTGYV